MKCMCTVFAMLLIFISVIAPTVANEADWMPDANLRSAVRSALSIADDDALTQQGMQDLTSFTATNSQISNITGFEHATELTFLDIRDNTITDVTPLSALTNLNLLRLKGNTLGDISLLSGLTSLTTLNLRLTGISSVSSLSELTNLEHLRVDDNSITDVEPLTSLINLQRLWVAGNELTNAHLLSSLTNLTRIDIEIPDPPASIPDANLAAAIRTQLEFAADTDITEADMQRLTYLSVSNLSISDLTGLEEAINLTELRLINNGISDISTLANLTSLTKLAIYENSNLSDISALANLTSLTSLHLHKNTISDISTLANLTSLTMLSLDNNDISDISALANLTNLLIVALSSNTITDISALANLTNLLILYLAGNGILDTSPIYPLLETNGGSLAMVDIPVSQYPPWDVNEDGNVDATDSALVTAALGQTGDSIVNSRTDVNGDSTVDADDLTLVTNNLDTNGDAPSSSGLLTLLDPTTLEKLDPATLEAQLDILRAKSDGSMIYLQAIALLESTLAALRPEKTVLLANYPNPFNPETWIPYQLAAPSHVRITIYDARGTLVRQLDLGHQREGYYKSRSRAAYWDGRNDFGERVASGIYFYQLEAGNMSFLRKMLILK